MSDLKLKLDEKIPENAIEHRNQGGREVSYLSGAFVIDRLNQVLGHLNWGYGITELKCVYEGKTEQSSGEVYAVSYIAKIKLHAATEVIATYEDVGYGDGFDKKNPGKAHELAVKEAVTDGIKRCAKNLGRSLGLELYLKPALKVGNKTSNIGSSGDYEITFGKKYLGKKIKEISLPDLIHYVAFLENSLAAKQEQPKGVMLEFLSNAKQVLINAEKGK